MIRIAVDAMGGDNAPTAIVEGTIGALERGFAQPGEVILVGQEDKISKVIEELGAGDLDIPIVQAAQIIGMDESPVEALRKKRDSSIVKAIALLKKDKAQAMISAGNTGAVVAGSIFLLGTLEGVHRPGIGVTFHTLRGPCTMIDVGANIHCKPTQLFQYGWMAANYMEFVLGIKEPSVGMINIGEEDEKGTSLLKDTYSLFESSKLNFIGNVEGQDLFRGRCDVVVCDGFVGNVILKVAEGLGAYLQHTLIDYVKTETTEEMKSSWDKVLKDIISRLDYAEYGAAPLLGVKGPVFISHGRSDAKAIYNAIRVARISVEQEVIKNLKTGLGEH